MDSTTLSAVCNSVPEHPARSAPMRATLSAANVETEYLRCGSGSTVILAAPPGLRDTLFAALAPHCRVIMPLATRPAMNESIAITHAFSQWMSDFLEGVGVRSARLVVGDPACAGAIEFAEQKTGVERLVLLTSQPHTLMPPSHLPSCALSLHSASLVEDAVQFLLADAPGRGPPVHDLP